jgi:hypothetical protein
MSTLKDVISEAIFGWGLRNDDGHNLSMDDTDEIAEYIVTRTPQPVVDVNQQLLNDIINMMIAVKGAIRLGCYGEAYEYLNAAIAAAQGRNNEQIPNVLG